MTSTFTPTCLLCNEPVGYLHRSTCGLSGVVTERNSWDVAYSAGDTPPTPAKPAKQPAQVMPSFLPGWTIKRSDQGPFKSITVTSPDGKVALLSNLARNPENVFYEFAEAVLAKEEMVALARDTALEDAARICDKNDGPHRMVAGVCADEIRALKTKVLK